MIPRDLQFQCIPSNGCVQLCEICNIDSNQFPPNLPSQPTFRAFHSNLLFRPSLPTYTPNLPFQTPLPIFPTTSPVRTYKKCKCKAKQTQHNKMLLYEPGHACHLLIVDVCFHLLCLFAVRSASVFNHR